MTLLENLIVLNLKYSQFHKVDDSKMDRLFKGNVCGVPALNLCQGWGAGQLRKSPLSGSRGRSLETSKDVCV